jgi:hypothetical protein
MSNIEEFRIGDLKPGEGIQIQTMNTLYEMALICGEVVLMRGGRHFPKARVARFKGSSWGGGPLIIPGTIVKGMNMEITHKGRQWGSPITTTPVHALYISRDGWLTRETLFDTRVDA